MPDTNSKRITILTNAEVNELYALPSLTQAEREEYFSLDDEMLREIRSMRKMGPPVYLILT